MGHANTRCTPIELEDEHKKGNSNNGNCLQTLKNKYRPPETKVIVLLYQPLGRVEALEEVK